jgi:hypothetical protein
MLEKMIDGYDQAFGEWSRKMLLAKSMPKVVASLSDPPRFCLMVEVTILARLIEAVSK